MSKLNTSYKRLLHLGGLLCFFSCTAALCGNPVNSRTSSEPYNFEKKILSKDLKRITTSPHPLGSPEQKKIADYLLNRAQTMGFVAGLQTFEVETPNPDVLGLADPGPRPLNIRKAGYNVWARTGHKKKSDCIVLLGSHYDTKHIPGLSYLGANDSGSSSAALLMQLELLQRSPLLLQNAKCDIMMVWFDGEEAILKDWYTSEKSHPTKLIDHTYGSRHFTSKLKDCKKKKCLPNELGGQRIMALVLMDMIGSKNIQITNERNSSQHLKAKLTKIAKQLKALKYLSKQTRPIEDDHLPFLEAGIPAINIIDFENLEFWHRPGDVFEQVSLESISLAASLSLQLALDLSAQ